MFFFKNVVLSVADVSTRYSRELDMRCWLDDSCHSDSAGAGAGLDGDRRSLGAYHYQTGTVTAW